MLGLTASPDFQSIEAVNMTVVVPRVFTDELQHCASRTQWEWIEVADDTQDESELKQSITALLQAEDLDVGQRGEVMMFNRLKVFWQWQRKHWMC
jgi:hypothetical protein